MTVRATGWLQDLRDPRDLGMTDLVRAPLVSVAPSADLSRARGKRLEQGLASACVSFAKARAIQMATELQGAPTLISCLFDYHIARAQEWAGTRVEDRPPLHDRGSYPRVSMTATRHVGFIPEASMPYDDLAVNNAPGPDHFLEAFPLRSLTYYAIDETGPARIAAVQLALSRGFPIVFGMIVDQAFLDHQGAHPVMGIDLANVAGRHMMTALAVTDGLVLFDNWWGKDWGFDDGMGLMTNELFHSPMVGDIYAITAVPPT